MTEVNGMKSWWKKSDMNGWLLTVVGSIMLAFAFNVFFIPNEIAPGGLSGLAQLVNAVTGFPVGVTIAVLNVPLLIAGWRVRGRVFILRTLLSVLLLSVFIDWIPMPAALTGLFREEMLLSTIFGSVISGLGMGMVIVGNSSTGGTDLVAIIIHKHVPAVRVAWLLMAVDALVVVGAAVVFDIHKALYALICVFITARCIDFVETGVKSCKAFYIISNHFEEISRRLNHEMDRGVTILNGKGAYSGQEKNVLFCVVDRQQIQPVKNLVKSVDPNAFVVVSDVKEALGEGFNAF
ncbi:MAG: YitT family protein [Eubacteriales bacterium]|nr:YitT family protein [Eubacteriales bacterium]